MLASGIVFGESPRWGPDGRLWLADWGTREIVAVGLDGRSEVVVELGFTLQGEYDFEYPPGHWMRCNDWELNL